VTTESIDVPECVLGIKHLAVSVEQLNLLPQEMVPFSLSGDDNEGLQQSPNRKLLEGALCC
jgi:hypothetical protein